MAQSEVSHPISIILDEFNYRLWCSSIQRFLRARNFRNTSQAMHNHPAFLILLKMMMMILIPNTNPNSS